MYLVITHDSVDVDDPQDVTAFSVRCATDLTGDVIDAEWAASMF